MCTGVTGAAGNAGGLASGGGAAAGGFADGSGAATVGTVAGGNSSKSGSPDYKWIESRLWKLLEDYSAGKIKTEVECGVNENCEVADEETI